MFYVTGLVTEIDTMCVLWLSGGWVISTVEVRVGVFV